MLNSFTGGPVYQYTPSHPAPTEATDFTTLSRRLDSLELACSAMWSILKEQHGFTDAQLVDAIHAADARDGQLDNKMTSAQAMCPHCGKKALTRTANKCLWCGAPMGITPL